MNYKNESKRNINIDAIKGWAIILVVLGHAVQQTYENYDTIAIFNFIYSFHMPLFVFISGFVSFKDGYETDIKWLGKRAAGLLLPYFAWMFWINKCSVFYFIRHITIIYKTLDSGSYWFLWTLFWLCFTLFVTNMIINVCKAEKIDWLIYLCAVGTLNLIFYKLHFTYLGIYTIAWLSFFYLFGYYINKHKLHYKLAGIRKYKILSLIFAIIWIMIACLWKRADEPVYITYLAGIIGRGKVFKIMDLGMKYFVPLLGIYCSCDLVRYLGIKVKNVLAYMGQRTLYIYILSAIFFRNIVGIMWIDVIYKTIRGVVISLAAAYVVEKNYIGKIFFGNR